MRAWINDVWASFTDLPSWVQVWVGLVLVPANVLPLGFLGEPYAWPMAILSVGGMMPNLYILVKDRAFGPVMALSHLVLWPPLIVLIFFAISQVGIGGLFGRFLLILMVVDLVSIGFDILDARKWVRARKAPG